MFLMPISKASLNIGHVGSKTRSPNQILGNACLHDRGHICDPIVMKLNQNVCRGNIFLGQVVDDLNHLNQNN